MADLVLQLVHPALSDRARPSAALARAWADFAVELADLAREFVLRS